MKFLNSFSIFFLWITGFSIFIFFFLGDAYSEKYEYIILAPPEILKPTPAGEITTGFQLEQPVDWNLISDSKLNQKGTLCIDLILANYNDRKNSGTFSMDLRAGHMSQEILLNANAVHDNDYQRFCFNALPLRDIAHKSTTLTLKGVDSPPGKAITAWMTSDITRGHARRGNQELDKSLVFSISVMTESNKKPIWAIVLTVLCGLSISVLFWPTRSGLR
ncbi:hypothetical protein [Collimonas fungivorans]|uniref:hypothetical protein n=1 Tax=Collimonas fungivorans TaxID=158899 RepID=UPI0009DB612C|nr:hypothetical protein [Collimonas fungivorans]